MKSLGDERGFFGNSRIKEKEGGGSRSSWPLHFSILHFSIYTMTSVGGAHNLLKDLGRGQEGRRAWTLIEGCLWG